MSTSLQEAANEGKPSMLVWCAWCPSYGREPAFLGSKPGEGVSHGICPACSLLVARGAHDANANRELTLGSRPASGEGVISSDTFSTCTSLAIPSSGPYIQRHDSREVLPADCHHVAGGGQF